MEISTCLAEFLASEIEISGFEQMRRTELGPCRLGVEYVVFYKVASRYFQMNYFLTNNGDTISEILGENKEAKTVKMWEVFTKDEKAFYPVNQWS